MTELKHVKTFEQFSTEESEPVNEGLFTSLKTDIDKFLKAPEDVKVADKLLSTAFAKSFAANPKLNSEVLALAIEEKVKILTKASEKLTDPKVGVLKLFKSPEGEYQVGGVSVAGGAAHSAMGK